MTTIDTRDRAKTRRTFIRDHRASENLRILRRLRGDPSVYVDSAPVREHLERLHAIGLPDQAIARAAGVASPTVVNIRRGQYARCLRDVAVAVLGVTHAPHPAQIHVLTVGARRRLQGLGRIGWTHTAMGAELGVSREALQSQVASTLMTRSNWQAIRVLYARLSLVPGDSIKTRNTAARRGWPAPLAWEGRDIDDPNARPWTAADDEAADPEVDHALLLRLLALRETTMTPRDGQPIFVVPYDARPIRIPVLGRGLYVVELLSRGWSGSEVRRAMGTSTTTMRHDLAAISADDAAVAS